MSSPGELLTSCLGRQIPGGCDDCDAYQTVTAETAGVWTLHVHHDETCPTWRAIRRARVGRRS